MPNKLTDNFLLQTGQPLDARYLTGALAAYADVAAANAAVPVAQRHVGLKVLIGTAEYWWSGGVANENLVAVSTGGAGTGDVVGPASSTDNAIALFDGIDGELLQDSPLTFNGILLSSSNAGLEVKANGGTSASLNVAALEANISSPDGTDKVSLIDGEIAVSTNNVTRISVTDGGMQLGGSGARVTTILNTAAGDSTSETAGVTAGWVKTFGVPDGDKGDITVSAGGATWTIDAQAVTFAKIQNIDGQSLIGRHASGSGEAQKVTINGGLEFNGADIRRQALTGDVAAEAGSNTTTIGNNAVTNAKAADMATGRVKARLTAGTGDPEDVTLAALRTAAGLDLITRSDTLSPPNIPQIIEITGITVPAEYADVLVQFLEIDAAGRPVWEDATNELRVSVVGTNWQIATKSDSSYSATKPYNSELSPVGLTGWTLVSGTGAPSAITADTVVTPIIAGEIIRWGDGPYRYYISNSTSAGDYSELRVAPAVEDGKLALTDRADRVPDDLIPADAKAVRNRLAPTDAEVTGTTRTLAASDTGVLLIFTNASGCAISIPTTPSPDWQADALIYGLRATGAGALSFDVTGSNVTPNNSKIADIAVGGLFGIRRRGATSTWDFI